MLGQMMEPVERFKTNHETRTTKNKPWTLTGAKGRKPNIIRSLLLKEGALEELNKVLQEKYRKIEADEKRYEAFNTDDASIILVAYGTVARIAKQAMLEARRKNIKVGLIRPISLWPFPKDAFDKFKIQNSKFKTMLVVEMSTGQMLEDVKLSVEGKIKVNFYGRSGGGIPTEEEILKQIKVISK
jgi:2-oxoglutarate ferredoxin oxidoreductase subunit alpha